MLANGLFAPPESAVSSRSNAGGWSQPPTSASSPAPAVAPAAVPTSMETDVWSQTEGSHYDSDEESENIDKNRPVLTLLNVVMAPPGALLCSPAASSGVPPPSSPLVGGLLFLRGWPWCAGAPWQEGLQPYLPLTTPRGGEGTQSLPGSRSPVRPLGRPKRTSGLQSFGSGVVVSSSPQS